MYRFFLLFLTLLYPIHAIDHDLDGVDDTLDKCPNTPFGELANTDGCTTEVLYRDTHFDLIVGGNYANTNTNTQQKLKTLTTSMQADLYQGNFTAQLNASYYRSQDESYKESGWNDTQITFLWNFKPIPSISLLTGVGIILPTYDNGYANEATDYMGSISLQWDVQPYWYLFGGYNYTVVNDTDIPSILTYKNTNAYNGGLGYKTPSGFVSVSYNSSDSIYHSVEAIKTVSLASMIGLDQHWFLLVDYRYGLSDSASNNDGSIRIGYYF